MTYNRICAKCGCSIDGNFTPGLKASHSFCPTHYLLQFDIEDWAEQIAWLKSQGYTVPSNIIIAEGSLSPVVEASCSTVYSFAEIGF